MFSNEQLRTMRKASAQDIIDSHIEANDALESYVQAFDAMVEVLKAHGLYSTAR